jgi:uncharacterized membrane protein
LVVGRHSETFTVDAPPGVVWLVLSDVEHWPEWTDSVTAAELVTGGPLAVGSQVRLRQPRLPTVVWTVDQLTPGTSFSWRAGGPGIASRGEHRVEPAAGGSRVTLAFSQTGPLSGLLDALTGRLVARYVRMEADGLKRRAEH